MKTLNNISKVLNNITKWLLIVCFAVMTISYFGQIVLRYVFDTGFRWTEELTRYVNIILVMFGCAVLSGNKAHINISAFEAIVPEKFRKWVFLFQQIVSLIFFGVAIFIGFDMMELAGTQVSTNLRIPMKFVYSVFPLAFTFLVFQTIMNILNDILKIGKKEGAQ